jgi:hypothetical protein
MRVIFVTGYLPLNVMHRSRAEYLSYGAQLCAVGWPTVAYLDPSVEIDLPKNVTRQHCVLDQCWYKKLLTPEVRNPIGDGDKKDTFEYYVVEHQKTTWAAQALALTGADVAIWIDFGLFHLGDFSAALREYAVRVTQNASDKIIMPNIRPLPSTEIDCSRPQWHVAGGVFAVPRQQAEWFDATCRETAQNLIAQTGLATWEVNTWAVVAQKNRARFKFYASNHDISLFTGYQPMKIAVYALAKNEEQHAAAWAASCKDADYCVVTDTGSTDKTPDILRAAGVAVHTGNVMPWRWDEAHNLSLHHVPSDADVCVRLDLDERFKPGWREAIEKAWKPGMTKLRYMYTWSMTSDGKPLRKFPSDRVHARTGMRWTGATHEGLVKWDGQEMFGWSDELEILHHRDAGKKHSTDFVLLQAAVKEMPHDARMHWYLARQMDYENHADTVTTFTKYLDMPGGSPAERAYACRVLARRIPDKAEYWLQRSIQEEPNAPDGYFALAKRAHANKDHLTAYFYAKHAVDRINVSMTHASDNEAFGHLSADIAGVNAYLLGLDKEALKYTKLAFARNPGDLRLKSNIEQLEEKLKAH